MGADRNAATAAATNTIPRSIPRGVDGLTRQRFVQYDVAVEVAGAGVLNVNRPITLEATALARADARRPLGDLQVRPRNRRGADVRRDDRYGIVLVVGRIGIFRRATGSNDDLGDVADTAAVLTGRSSWAC